MLTETRARSSRGVPRAPQQAADLEQLAAFIDGRLSGEQKAKVEERLLRDEDYYEVFLETVRFQEEQKAAGEGGGGRVVWWRSWRVAVPLVAVVLLVVVVGLLVPGERPLPGDRLALLDPSAIVAREGWDQPGWTVLRSGNIAEGRYRPEEIAFRLGVRAVDLRVALAADDRQAAERLVSVLEQLAGSSDLLLVSAAYGELGNQFESVEPEALVTQVAKIERSMFESFEEGAPEARRLALGAWSEAGRLAAFSRDAGALARVVREDPGIDEVATEIETLELILEGSEPGEDAFEEAEVAFRGIAKSLGG